MKLIDCFARKFLFFMCLSTLLFSGCTDDEEKTLGVWTKRSDLDGPVRRGAATFTIGDIAYVCGGYKSNVQPTCLNDLWAYDMERNYWTSRADMPDDAPLRSGAVGFSIGTKGYITTGYNGDNRTYYKDTWEYDSTTNTWTKMDDFAGSARTKAVAFSIGNYGYVGTGKNDDGQLKEFYRFDPTAPAGSQWELITGYGGGKREGSTVFVINDIAYLVGGVNDGSGLATDLWSYNPAKNEWTQLRDIIDSSSDDYDDDYTSITRTDAVGFVIDDLAYFVTGQLSGGSYRYDYWIYNPETDLWYGEDLTPFGGTARVLAVGFSNGKRGFVATGGTSSARLDDVWELSPYEYEEN